jgi:polysaccharide biosynthesis protein PslH
LINNIFPHVQAQFPDACLFIVGEHLPSNLVRVPNKNVILTGYVPDVKTYLDRATLVVVPLRLGGGMRVKVLEALAAGKPIVASSRAVEGLRLVNGEQALLADDDDEFSRAIIDLLGNPQKRASLASRARAWANENLRWDRVADEYKDLYLSLLKC